MSRWDRVFAEYRERALSKPLTRANSYVWPAVVMSGGAISIGLSVNK